MIAGALILPGKLADNASAAIELNLGEYPGAMVRVDPTITVPDVDFRPSLRAARSDNAAVYDDRCHVRQPETEPTGCRYGPEDAEHVIVLAGDSHAARWLPALRGIAEANGHAIVNHTKSACPFMLLPIERGGEAYEECLVWVEAALDDIIALQPDLVVTAKIASTRALGSTSTEENDEMVVAGMAETWRRLGEAGLPVLAIEQSPRFSFDMPDCVAGDGIEACTRSREEALQRCDPTPDAAGRVDTAFALNMNDWICMDHTCPPVIGNVLVYRDPHHLTATYARSLAVALADPVVQMVETGNLSSAQDEN